MTAPAPSSAPKGVLVLLAGSAVLLAMIFSLSRGHESPAGPVAKTASAEEALPRISRSSSSSTPAPSLSRSEPQALVRAAPRPEMPAAAVPPGEHPSHPYLSEDMLTLDDSYDPNVVFHGVSEEFGVPADLLKTLAFVESQGEHRNGRRMEDGSFGVMRLRERPDVNTLDEAARLLGVEKAELVRDPVQNIRGAAAVLRSYHDSSMAAEANPWMLAVTLYSGRAPEDAVRYSRELENILHEGLTHTLKSGQTLTVAPGQAKLLAEQE